MGPACIKASRVACVLSRCISCLGHDVSSIIHARPQCGAEQKFDGQDWSALDILAAPFAGAFFRVYPSCSRKA